MTIRVVSRTHHVGSRGLARTCSGFDCIYAMRASFCMYSANFVTFRLHQAEGARRARRLPRRRGRAGDLNDSVLKWWKVRELKWPNLSKMVKQYMAAPCSGGGVERVFSAAGKSARCMATSPSRPRTTHSSTPSLLPSDLTGSVRSVVAV